MTTGTTIMMLGLESISLLSELSTQSLEDISEFCSKVVLMEGESLISENDLHTNDLFLLCSGRVEIITSSKGVTSEEVSLSKQDKEIYGEISWLLHGKRSATIRCKSDVEAIRIDGNSFMAYLENNTEAGFLIMRHIAKILSERLNHTNDLLKQILWNNFT